MFSKEFDAQYDGLSPGPQFYLCLGLINQSCFRKNIFSLLESISSQE
jgi:hypothetical protein